jgi:nicotinate-nucleotide pyrophosphorylase (carboxylating)
MTADTARRDEFDWDAEPVRALVRASLEEDIGTGDITTAATVAPSLRARAWLLAKQELILAGMPLAERVFRQLDPGLRLTSHFSEGARIASGAVVAGLDGRASAILSAERTALNFLAHLTGVATLTNRFVRALAGSATQLRDTRKTTPLLRCLEKYAVRVGGGVNHRFGLADGVLIKENHIAAAGGVAAAIHAARAAAGPGLAVEVEVGNEAELRQALSAGPDELLLDNLSPAEAGRLVAIVRRERPGCRVELSGGITLDNVADYGRAGADFVSVGALTHSASAADFSLLVEWAGVE